MALPKTKTLKSKVLACAVALGALTGAHHALADSSDDEYFTHAWTVNIGKKIHIAPLITPDKVVSAAEDGPLHAMDPNTGKTLWTYSPPEGVWERGYNYNDGRIIVCVKGGKLAALDNADGKELWKIDLGINCQRPQHFDGNTVYVPTTYVGPGLSADPLTGAKLFAIEAATGKVMWVHEGKEFLYQTPTSNSDTLFLAGTYKDYSFDTDEGGPAGFYALDKNTGAVKWAFDNHDGTPKALYATEDRLAVIAYQDFIQGYDTKTGELLYRRDTGNWVPSLVGRNNTVYFGSANTFVHAWAVEDAKTKWMYSIPGAAFDYLLIKPYFEGDRLYFLSQRGYLYALNADTGELIARELSEKNLKSYAGMSLGHGHIYIGGLYGDVHAYKILK